MKMEKDSTLKYLKSLETEEMRRERKEKKKKEQEICLGNKKKNEQESRLTGENYIFLFFYFFNFCV